MHRRGGRGLAMMKTRNACPPCVLLVTGSCSHPSRVFVASPDPPFRFYDRVMQPSLQGLRREPDRLRAEAQVLQESLGELCRRHHVTFVEHYACMELLSGQSQSFQEEISAISASVAALRKDCNAFGSGTRDVVRDLKRNRQTLQHHMQVSGNVWMWGFITHLRGVRNSQLVELLEMPQLMDACIRNNLYEEAIELVAFANVLEKRHMLDGKESPEDNHVLVIASLVSPSDAGIAIEDRCHQPSVLRSMIFARDSCSCGKSCSANSGRRFNCLDLSRCS
jgi:hypothetical protein